MNTDLNELKFQLQSELQKDGTVENIKMQLRYKLLERLQLQQKKILTSAQDSKTESLQRRVASSLVADFLKAAGLDYCLSVFVPESGYRGSLLDNEELCVLLKVESEGTKSVGVLQTLCHEILQIKPREPVKSNASTQTYTGDAVMNLEQKLTQIDSLYRSKIEGELIRPQMEMEEKLNKMKRDYELRMKAELQAEITRIREFEMQAIRMEETEKQRQRNQEYREDLERNYQERLQKLREREKDVLEKASQKAREVESLGYNYRQKIMKETELLRMKEQELVKERELNEENLKLQKQKLDDKERQLQRKIQEVEDQQLNHNKKYQNDLHIHKLEIHNQLHEEKEQVRVQKKSLDQEFLKIEQLQNTLETIRKENRQLVSENERYLEQIKELKRKRQELEYEYQNLKDQHRNLEQAQRREQELSRRWEQELKIKEDELKIARQNIEHKDLMLMDHKQLQTDNTKKLTKDIQQYQERLERADNEIKELKKIISEKENIQQNFIQTTPKEPIIITNDSILVNYQNQDHKHRINLIQNEMAENKLKRQEELRRLQEDWHTDKSVFQMRFKETWDLHESSVQFSQVPSVMRKQNQQQGIESQSASKVKHTDDPLNIFRIEEDQSQIVQSGLYQKIRNNKNIIQETYHEGFD